MNKEQLRRELRARFPGEALRCEESRAIRAHILQWSVWQRSACVALYMPLRREADIAPLMEIALAEGKTVLLPRVEGPGRMTLRRVSGEGDLLPGSYGIREPGADTEILPFTAPELILVPLEGLDPTGTRLGKGGGFYDRLLAEATGLSAGVLLRHQWTERIPAEPWDIPLSAAVDADGIHLFSPIQS